MNEASENHSTDQVGKSNENTNNYNNIFSVYNNKDNSMKKRYKNSSSSVFNFSCSKTKNSLQHHINNNSTGVIITNTKCN